MYMLKRSLSSVSLRCSFRRVSTASAAVDLRELPQSTFRPEDNYLTACKQLNFTLESVKKEMAISKIQNPYAKAFEDCISEEQRSCSLNEQHKFLKKELGLETDDKTTLCGINSNASVAVDLRELPEPTFRHKDYIKACVELNHTLDILIKEMRISKIQKSYAKALEDKIMDERRRYSRDEYFKAFNKARYWVETDDTTYSDELRERINLIKHKFPPHVLEVIEEEFQLLEASSSIFDETRKYLDWVTATPSRDCRLEEVTIPNFKPDEDWHPGTGYLEKITHRNGGIKPKKVEVTEATLLSLVENCYYRRKACVQNLQEHIHKIDSKIALWQKVLQMFRKSYQLLEY